MEDTASGPVQIVGETVPETDVPSLGLTPQEIISAESLRDVTGPCTAEARSQSEVDIGAASDAYSGESVSNPGAGGSQAIFDVANQKTVTATSSRRPHSRSPLERALSPKRSQASLLRARFSRLGQSKLLQYAQIPDNVPSASVPRDTVTRGEADAALAQLQE